jgi:hypothetical protein
MILPESLPKHFLSACSMTQDDGSSKIVNYSLIELAPGCVFSLLEAFIDDMVRHRSLNLQRSLETNVLPIEIR